MGSWISTMFGNKTPGTSNDEANPPAGIVEIIEGVWQLQKGRPEPDMEIIFFHGLQMGDFRNAFWKTWQSNCKDGLVLWPQEWLGKLFPGARILSVSYDSSAMSSQGQLPMYNLGENLVHDIILNNKNIGQKCPVILVGHSLGGIVIKQFVCSAFLMRNKFNLQTKQEDIRKIDTFLNQNLKGVCYYSTPHHGSRLADLAKLIPFKSPYLKLLKTLDTQTNLINEEFREHRVNLKNCHASAMGENLPTKYLGFEAIVVPEGSARYDIDTYFTVKADHFNICKPRTMASASFQKLYEFIENRTEIQISQEDTQIVPAPANVGSSSSQSKAAKVAQPIGAVGEDTGLGSDLQARFKRLKESDSIMSDRPLNN